MIVKIDKLSHDFKGITNINNKTFFVSGVLPDETVDMRITGEKKKFGTGRVNSVIEASLDRCSYECPYASLCGGCSTSYINDKKEIEIKKDIFKDIMKRYANIDVNPDIIESDLRLGYRNKITFKVNNGHLSLTYEDSHEVVNVSKCLLVNDNINKVISLFEDFPLTHVTSVVIMGYDDIMVIIDGDIDSDLLTSKFKDNVSSIVVNDTVIYGEEYIKYNVSKYTYAVYPKSFFQVNTLMIDKLYSKVLEYAGSGNKLLDLYCGAGTIGIYLSNNFKSVIGVEINNSSIKAANDNKKLNNISNCDFLCSNANCFDVKEFDVIVVDPPRSGLDNITMNKLLESGAKRIVYVSCNPITLARDIKYLSSIYEVNDMTLFDMFPNTKHVECVSVLHRKTLEK